MEIPTWVFILFISTGFAYYLLILIVSMGWFFLQRFREENDEPSVKVSIIVPARNEENYILACIESLASQNYPKKLFEILVVDDHSEDKTATLTEIFATKIRSAGINLRLLRPDAYGKKKVIDFAIQQSKGELILTTDADCIAPQDWVATIAAFYEKYHPKMIVAPVLFSESGSLFSQWQALEFYSLIASGAGAISSGHPMLCNGANLAYTREAYLAVGGFTMDERYASGDDTFLLFGIAARYGKHAVHFLKSSRAMIKTDAASTPGEFVQQRLRWVSKTKGYTDAWTIQVAFVVFLFNVFLLTGLIWGIFNIHILVFTMILWGTKALIDFPLLAGFVTFVKQRKLLRWYLPLAVIYPFYVSFFGLAGQVWKFRWKGRK